MRSSSIKSVVVISSVVFTLSLAAPCADARPSQPRRGTQTQSQSQTQTSLRRAMNQVLRFFGIISDELPSDPIPRKTNDPDAQTFTPPTDVTIVE